MDCENCLFYEKLNEIQGHCLYADVLVIRTYSCSGWCPIKMVNKTYAQLDSSDRVKIACYFVARLRRCKSAEALLEISKLIKKWKPEETLRESLLTAYGMAKDRLNG